MPIVRLLPFAAADGAVNMAADEALLESAAAGRASLRFYTWSVPTLSLGYFQPAAVAPSLAPDSPGVRRSTGGAAILHHHELTYALALPAGKDWQPPGSWVCRFHHLVQQELADRDVPSHVVVCGEERTLGDGLCFLHQTAGDLQVEGSKVAGSAQRKWKGTMLQHGSILLRRSEFTPHLPGINDRVGRVDLVPEGFAEGLAARLAEDTGWSLRPEAWSLEEFDRIEAIRVAKYQSPAWNEKR